MLTFTLHGILGQGLWETKQLQNHLLVVIHLPPQISDLTGRISGSFYVSDPLTLFC